MAKIKVKFLILQFYGNHPVTSIDKYVPGSYI